MRALSRSARIITAFRVDVSLRPGTRIGPYEIAALIGEGGMGQVYRATDTHLKRLVAVKVLPEMVATDADRLTRFQREAEVLARLNHPHIAQIHGLERSDGTTALVMELVEGPTLADRIAGGPIPLDELLPIARQITEALEAAHEQHIVHRDLKPANIKVRADGTVKVLDFGLAKAIEGTRAGGRDPTQSPTITLPVLVSGVGLILGTAAYMAPEQARGRTVDKRADIWAFGVVLYEMLTGVRAFDGEDVSITLAAVLKEEPDWSRLPTGTPPALRRLVTRCLKKSPNDRLRDIGDARTEIADLTANATELLVPVAAVAATQVESEKNRALRWTVAAAVLIAIGGGGGFAGYLLRSEPTPEVVRFTIAPPEKLAFNLIGGNIVGGSGSNGFNGGAISPDGRKIAFTTQDSSATVQMWVRSLDATAAEPLAGTEGATLPFWSPDSRFIGFFADGSLKRVDIAGGPPQRLAAAPNGRGASWNRDGVIVFAPDQNSGLTRISDGGSEPVVVTTLQKGETAHRRVSFLPDGRHFLYRASGALYGTSPQIMVAALDSGESKSLLPADSQAIYSSGHLLFVRGTTLMAQPFNPDTLALSGAPFPIAEEVSMDTVNGLAAFDASGGGVLTYRTGSSSGASTSELTWYDRTGKVVGTVDKPGRYNSVALFAAGTRAAVSVADPSGNIDLWVHEFARGTSTRLTSNADVDFMPAWSPDGSRIAWSSRRDGVFNVYQKPADGTGSDEAVYKSNESKYVADWSPDGRFLLFSGGTIPRLRLFVLPMTGNDRQPRPYLQSEFNETQGQFSPDGRFVAYTSDETGRLEAYVQPFPVASTGRWKISQGGGAQPQWRGDGKELFFISSDSKLMAVAISPSTTFSAGTPKMLFAAPIVGSGATFINNRYGVTPDGQRFLINALKYDPSSPAPITVVLNWQEEQKRRVPAR